MNAMPLPIALADVLARGDVWRGDTLARCRKPPSRAAMPNSMPNLPGGGWPRGNLTEILSTVAASAK
jgi:hypothetical protein